MLKNRPPFAHSLVLACALWLSACQPTSAVDTMKPADPAAAAPAPTSPAPATATGKNDQSAQENLYRLNPNPQQAYEVVLTIQDAPGPFKVKGWSAMYEATGCNYVTNEWAGARGQPRRLVEIPFTESPDGSQVATLFLDALQDEDYYGNGVCRWRLTSAGPWFQATGDSGDTTFDVNLNPEQLLAESPVVLFYWKGHYPRAKVDRFSTSGNTDREKFAPEIRNNLFSMTLKPRKARP